MSGDLISRAVEIAAGAHAGQTDKAGEPYVLHPLRVMLRMKENTERICAALHDVVEDSLWTLEDLRREGFSDEVISVLDCLTKRPGEAYDDFIGRVLQNETACRVKLADLADNMDMTRIKKPTEETAQRMQKYAAADARIRKHLTAREE